MGLARAWFPSRRSVDSHIGAWVRVLDGHWRFGTFRGVYGLYFRVGSLLGRLRCTHTSALAPCSIRLRFATHSIGMIGGGWGGEADGDGWVEMMVVANPCKRRVFGVSQ